MRISDWSSDVCSSDLLSQYGWSKYKAERIVMASGLDWTIIRPPAIYGPADTAMLELFRLASRRLMLLPPGGRLSVIEVSDLARLLLACVQDDEISIGGMYEDRKSTRLNSSH